LCGALFALSACGFEPLYVERKSGEKWYYHGEFDTTISQEIAHIRVEPISDRIGQMIRNELIDSFTPRGEPKCARYRLEVTGIDRDVVQQALRKDITATRERVRYKVNYALYEIETNERLVQGNSLAYLSYDILANPYSTTFSQKKIEKDAAKIIANDISLRMGAFFHSTLTKRGDPNEF
jgi:LPS-assembly lipoprotein